jgi:hypothetical protein
MWYIADDKKICNNCSDFVTFKANKGWREKMVFDALQDNGVKFASYDKIPPGSCNQYRPDFVIDAETRFIIVEVDEYQHKYNECRCEQGRMINIAQDLGGGMPVVFIRFNPDGYVDSNGTQQQNNSGNAITKLLETIEMCKTYNFDSILSIVYLFFNKHFPKRIDLYSVDVNTFGSFTINVLSE